MGADAVLELSGVTKTYDDGHPVHALRETGLRIQQGEYVSVTGPSGAGKSTLLNVLGLLDRPTTGSYRVRGTETVDGAERLRVAIRGQVFGFVFQAFHLLGGRTVTENVELGMLYAGYRAKRRRAMASAAIERIGLAHRASADPRTLSGGERQRAAIARAIAAGPSVLFCDEPTGNLDSATTDNVLGVLRELHGDGLTIVTVSHQREVADEADRKLSVTDGVVTEAGEACAE